MKTKTLNRDYKRLFKANKALLKKANDSTEKDYEKFKTEGYWKEQEKLKKELRRLFCADSGFKYINRTSIIIFMDLNQSFRAIKFHLIHPNTEGI